MVETQCNNILTRSWQPLTTLPKSFITAEALHRPQAAETFGWTNDAHQSHAGLLLSNMWHSEATSL